jgi:hypothetical protein
MMTMWAIKLNSPEHEPNDYAGWLFFRQYEVPATKSGYVGTALFPSRQSARDNLPRVRKAFPRAAVRKLRLVDGGKP